MTWTPTDGTEAISSWLNQGVLFALVLAVAMVIGCAVVWAVGSLAGERRGGEPGPGRDRGRLAAALLLGAGFSYRAMDLEHPGRRVRRRPRAVRHRRHPGDSRRLGVHGPVRAMDGEHQRRPRQQTDSRRSPPTAALTEQGQVLRQQPRRAGR